MHDRVHDLLFQYVNMVHDVYGKELKEIILYGSYARGDFVHRLKAAREDLKTAKDDFLKNHFI